MQYSVADTASTSPYNFCLPSATASPATQIGATAPCTTGTQNARNQACTVGRIEIYGALPAASTYGTYCGVRLNTINTATISGSITTKGQPYQVNLVVIGATTTNANGFKLNYTQRSSC